MNFYKFVLARSSGQHSHLYYSLTIFTFKVIQRTTQDQTKIVYKKQCTCFTYHAYTLLWCLLNTSSGLFCVRSLFLATIQSGKCHHAELVIFISQSLFLTFISNLPNGKIITVYFQINVLFSILKFALDYSCHQTNLFPSPNCILFHFTVLHCLGLQTPSMRVQRQ